MSRNPAQSDSLVRMQEDLKRALAGDAKQVRWAMVIDLAKCAGCHACTVACIAENKLPPGVVYRPVIEHEIGQYPYVRRKFIPRPCMQCQNPPCVKVCPVNATWKDEQGVTVIDYTRCIGCRYCLAACPYGARTSDFWEWYTERTPEAGSALLGRAAAAKGYEEFAAAEYGQSWDNRSNRNSPVGNARKCHFCKHRLAQGMLPACVTSCIGRATIFGNSNDPESLVSEQLGSPRIFRLREELGTRPAVHYLA